MAFIFRKYKTKSGETVYRNTFSNKFQYKEPSAFEMVADVLLTNTTIDYILAEIILILRCKKKIVAPKLNKIKKYMKNHNLEEKINKLKNNKRINLPKKYSSFFDDIDDARKKRNEISHHIYLSEQRNEESILKILFDDSNHIIFPEGIVPKVSIDEVSIKNIFVDYGCKVDKYFDLLALPLAERIKIFIGENEK